MVHWHATLAIRKLSPWGESPSRMRENNCYASSHRMVFFLILCMGNQVYCIHCIASYCTVLYFIISSTMILAADWSISLLYVRSPIFILYWDPSNAFHNVNC